MLRVRIEQQKWSAIVRYTSTSRRACFVICAQPRVEARNLRTRSPSAKTGEVLLALTNNWSQLRRPHGCVRVQDVELDDHFTVELGVTTFTIT